VILGQSSIIGNENRLLGDSIFIANETILSICQDYHQIENIFFLHS